MPQYLSDAERQHRLDVEQGQSMQCSRTGNESQDVDGDAREVERLAADLAEVIGIAAEGTRPTDARRLQHRTDPGPQGRHGGEQVTDDQQPASRCAGALRAYVLAGSRRGRRAGSGVRWRRVHCLRMFRADR